MSHDLASALAALTPGRPLVITDADGVLLRFTGGLERFLNQRGLYLELTAYRLSGSIKRADDHSPVLNVETMALIEEFRRDLDDLEPVDGACEMLGELAAVMGVVVLSNVNPHQAVARRRNLDALGLDFPLIANDGGQGFLADKGTVVRALAQHAGAKTFFIDDLPVNLADVARAAPEVLLIHLAESPVLRKLIGRDFHAHCHADDWRGVRNFIIGQLG